MDGITAYALSKKVATSAVSGVKSMSVDGQTLTINTKDSGVLKMVFPTPSNGRSVTDIDVNDKNQIVFTMSDGTEITSGVIPTVKGADGKPGKDGKAFTYDDFTNEQLEDLKGTNGVSPDVTITEIDGGHTITITDADGTQSFNVLNGADGYSPSAKVEKENGIVTITITDKTGTTTAEIKENTGGTGEENVIEEIKVNGVALAPDENKSVNITVPTVDVDKNYVDTELAKKANTSDIPTKVSELQNDSNYQTDTDVTTTLTPYATKTYVGEQISNADHLKREIVTEIPDASTADEHTIYMLKIESATGNDKYREYLLIDGTMQCTGDTSVDLTDYAKTADVDNKLDNKVDKTEIPTFTNKTVLDGITAEKVADWDEAVTTKTALEAHTNSIVSSKTGVHGMRYFNDTLQVQNAEGEWIDIETGGSGGGGIAPNNVSDINLKTGNTKLTIAWSDPSDTIIEGQTLSTWKGTKLVQKVGSFPENPKDGTLILDNQTRDKYKTSGFEITGLTNGETYYFALFPYSDTGATNLNTANRISGTTQPYRTMTAVIDLTNSNPLSSVTYADDAVGMTKGSDAWDEFLGYYPVLLDASGNELGKLNPNNYAQYEDGTAAPINVLGSYDVMVAFPKRGLKISTENNKVTISMTDDPDNADFKYYAHSYGAHNNCDVVYVGAYKASVSNNKLYSCSGQSPLVSQTIGTFRTYANNRGTGYEQMTFYVRTYLCCAYLLRFGNLNSQAAVGQGYVKASEIANTGATNAQGMNYGTTSQTTQIKCLGIEDLWGNVFEWVDGIYSSSTRNILTAIYNKNMNDTGSGYQDNGQGASSDIANYMSNPQGTTETGFVAKEVSGSATTYFCDYAILYASKIAFAGGDYGIIDNAGVFLLYVKYSASHSNAYFGGRLIKFKTAE